MARSIWKGSINQREDFESVFRGKCQTWANEMLMAKS